MKSLFLWQRSRLSFWETTSSIVADTSAVIIVAYIQGHVVFNHCKTNLLKGLLRLTKKKWPELLALCEGWPVEPLDSPHKGPVLRKAFPCYDVIMTLYPTPLPRKRALLLLHVFNYASAVMFGFCQYANSIFMLILARAIVGFACGK